MSIREEDVVGQILDLISLPWALASVLALHVVSRLRDPMAPCTSQELIRTLHVPELSLVVWTDQHTQDAPPDRPSPGMHMGGFISDDGVGTPAAGLLRGRPKKWWRSCMRATPYK